MALTAGIMHTVALQSDGTLWAWGSNWYGQLGYGTASIGITKGPRQVGSGAAWASIAAGDYHTMGLQTDGTLWAWGNNGSGQLGDGTVEDKRAPVQVGSGPVWVAVAAGNSHTVALQADGTLWAWGGMRLVNWAMARE